MAFDSTVSGPIGPTMEAYRHGTMVVFCSSARQGQATCCWNRISQMMMTQRMRISWTKVTSIEYLFAVPFDLNEESLNNNFGFPNIALWSV